MAFVFNHVISKIPNTSDTTLNHFSVAHFETSHQFKITFISSFNKISKSLQNIRITFFFLCLDPVVLLKNAFWIWFYMNLWHLVSLCGQIYKQDN